MDIGPRTILLLGRHVDWGHVENPVRTDVLNVNTP